MRVPNPKLLAREVNNGRDMPIEAHSYRSQTAFDKLGNTMTPKAHHMTVVT